MLYRRKVRSWVNYWFQVFLWTCERGSYNWMWKRGGPIQICDTHNRLRPNYLLPQIVKNYLHPYGLLILTVIRKAVFWTNLENKWFSKYTAFYLAAPMQGEQSFLEPILLLGFIWRYCFDDIVLTILFWQYFFVDITLTLTLCCILIGRCCLGLETRVIIKISINPCYPINLD